MVKIDGFVVRVIFSWQHAVGDFTRHAVGASGHNIGDAYAFTTLFPATFQLVRGHRAAPQKTFFKS